MPGRWNIAENFMGGVDRGQQSREIIDRRNQLAEQMAGHQDSLDLETAKFLAEKKIADNKMAAEEELRPAKLAEMTALAKLAKSRSEYFDRMMPKTPATKTPNYTGLLSTMIGRESSLSPTEWAQRKEASIKSGLGWTPPPAVPETLGQAYSRGILPAIGHLLPGKNVEIDPMTGKPVIPNRPSLAVPPAAPAPGASTDVTDPNFWLNQ